MSDHQAPELKTLTPEECVNRLQAAVIGRIGYVADGMATIIPVNFALLDGDIVFCTAKGSKLSWLSLRGHVTFEADESSSSAQGGWSVLVRGHAHEVTDPTELAALRRGSFRSWWPSPHEHWVRISIDTISGRELHSQLARNVSTMS